MNFSQLGLNEAYVRKCQSLGYIEPTPIQTKAIPLVLKGADLIGCAETGTGKTAAFLLPIMQHLRVGPGVRLLILAPTRELASQIEESYRQFALNKAPACVRLTGGSAIRQQLEALRRGASVIVATPGRLLDHIERGSVNLAQVQTLVLDEADRMLDIGFWPAIRRIVAKLPSDRQTLLFSATMSPKIEQLARTTMTKPQLIEIGARGRAAANVEQTAYPVASESKTALLLDLLERDPQERDLVFTRTRRGADRLSHILKARNHRVNCIHGDRTQPQRETALRGFREGRISVLVATDVAARGIDVDLVSRVINYDVPAEPESYVHRIGRTGRAGNLGRAITLVSPVDELSMRAIERLTGQAVERVMLPAFGSNVIERPNGIKHALSGAGTRTRSFRPRRFR